MTEIILAILTLLGAFLAGWLYRKPSSPPPKETPITPPEINHAETHKMDDDTTTRPADTYDAERLRKWANSDGGISAVNTGRGNPKPPNEAGKPPRPHANVPPPPVDERYDNGKRK